MAKKAKGTTKIVYNTCFGGFSLSDEAEALYNKMRESAGLPLLDYCGRDMLRTDPLLVAVVEAMGEKANGMCADLAIFELPKGARYRIDEYDGSERVMTIDDYKWLVA